MFLERFVWFDSKTRHGRFPNAFTLAAKFEISTKTAQRSVDYFRDRLQAPIEYLLSRKGYCYTNSDSQIPVTRLSQYELLALLISRKLSHQFLRWIACGEVGLHLPALGIPPSRKPPRTHQRRGGFLLPMEGPASPTSRGFQSVLGNLIPFCGKNIPGLEKRLFARQRL